MKTDDLIVQIVQDLVPVRPLPPPSARLVRWLGRAALVTAVSVIIIGARPDALSLLAQPSFAGLEAAMLSMALLAAACAFVLSVPGAERTPLQRIFPFGAGAAWVLTLIAALRSGGDPLSRLFALPVHPLCIIEIAGLALLPGWALFGLLRRAAPLQRGWTAAFAMLAALAFGAAGTQVLCPIDDPAHHLVGHVAPLAILAVMGTLAFQRSLDWMRKSG